MNFMLKCYNFNKNYNYELYINIGYQLKFFIFLKLIYYYLLFKFVVNHIFQIINNFTILSSIEKEF